ILIIIKSCKLGIVDPRSLDELELPRDVCIETEELQTAIEVVGPDARRIVRRTILAPASKNAVTLADGNRCIGPRLRIEGVSRIAPPHVGPDRTAEAVGIRSMIEKIIAFRPGRIVAIRRFDERRTAAP